MAKSIIGMLTAVVALNFTGVASAAEPDSLDALQWENRVLLVCAQKRYPPSKGMEARQFDLIDDDGFAERDLIIVYTHPHGSYFIQPGTGNEDRDFSGGATARREHCMAGRFEVKLIGKDGDVKHVSDGPITSQTLFLIIDAMPMRRREMAD
ncbi:MAG: DUF4174 domain-containing protein [Pseudomonadota bacterium]